MLNKIEVKESSDKNHYRVIFYGEEWSDAYKMTKQNMYELFLQLQDIVKNLEKENV